MTLGHDTDRYRYPALAIATVSDGNISPEHAENKDATKASTDQGFALVVAFAEIGRRPDRSPESLVEPGTKKSRELLGGMIDALLEENEVDCIVQIIKIAKSNEDR